MKITKDLKHASFEYDEDLKTFTIIGNDGNHVALNKVYAFAFMRFVVRMAQRNWLRSKKTLDKDGGDVLQCKNQMEMFQ
jgi:hypothetical protein